jgi:uncharacterized protein (DUF2141 family)
VIQGVRLAVVAVLCLTPPLGVVAQTRDTATLRATAGISGVVVSDDQDSRPVRRVRVTCSGGDASATAITDDRGRFQFPGLRAGRYTVSATKDAWVPTSYGAKRPMRPGSAIPIADGQQAEIVIRLLHGSVLTGVVLDHANQPAAQTSVNAMRYVMQNGERRLAPAGTGGVTDDRGVYRIYSLPPGEYVIRASAQPSAVNATAGELRMITDRAASSRGDDERTVAFAPTFYPGTAIAAQAVTVTLGRAEERGGLDFTLQLVPTARVEGTVMLPDGTVAPAGTQVNLLPGPQPAGAATAGMRTARIASDGTFVFADVSPGTYTVLARATVPSPQPNATPAMVWASTEIAVDGDRISGLSLGLQPGMTIAGRVRFDGTRLTPPGDLNAVRVSLAPIQAEGTVAFSPGTNGIDAQGRFIIGGVTPGRYRLIASFPGSGRPDGWHLRSAVVFNQDTLDVPITVQPSQSISDASIVFTDRPAELTGTVHNAIGGAPNEFTVILFSADPSHWLPRARRIQAVRPSADGAFAFRGLPPGEYHLAAIDDIENGEWFDPAFLQRLLPTAMKLTLGEGERKVQEIRLGGA